MATTENFQGKIERIKRYLKRKENIDPKFFSEKSKFFYNEIKAITHAIEAFEVIDPENRLQPKDKVVFYQGATHGLYQQLRNSHLNNSFIGSLALDFDDEWVLPVNADAYEKTRLRALYHLGRGSMLQILSELDKYTQDDPANDYRNLFLSEVAGRANSGLPTEVGKRITVGRHSLPRLSDAPFIHKDLEQFHAAQQNVFAPN